MSLVSLLGKTAELAALNATVKDIDELHGILRSMDYNYEQNDFEQYPYRRRFGLLQGHITMEVCYVL